MARITNARLSFQTQQIDHLTLDRFEIRRIAQKESGRLIELGIALPKEMTLVELDGTETRITLKDARANALVEAQSGKGQETAIEIASARIDQPKTGAWGQIWTTLDVVEACYRARWQTGAHRSNSKSKRSNFLSLRRQSRAGSIG